MYIVVMYIVVLYKLSLHITLSELSQTLLGGWYVYLLTWNIVQAQHRCSPTQVTGFIVSRGGGGGKLENPQSNSLRSYNGDVTVSYNLLLVSTPYFDLPPFRRCSICINIGKFLSSCLLFL